MSLRQLRNRVNALKRKLALPLVVIRLRPLAEEFCYEWAQARADFGRHKAPSKQMPQPFTSVETGPLSLIRRAPATASASPPSWTSTDTWSAAAPWTPFPNAIKSSAVSFPGLATASSRQYSNWMRPLHHEGP